MAACAIHETPIAWSLILIVEHEEVIRVPVRVVEVEVGLRALVPVIFVRHEEDTIVPLFPASLFLGARVLVPEGTRVRPVAVVFLTTPRVLHLHESGAV